jgi:hypothetical protein
MCPIYNGFQDWAISLYSSKVIDKKKYYMKDKVKLSGTR